MAIRGTRKVVVNWYFHRTRRIPHFQIFKRFLTILLYFYSTSNLVFIILGLDLYLHYAHRQAKQVDEIFKFLDAINEWFDKKLIEIRKNLNREDNRYVKIVSRNGNVVEKTELLLSIKPTFVLITIPEVGDWTSFFKVSLLNIAY